MKDGVRFARHGDLQLRVELLPSGRWYANVRPAGACAVCLGDNFATPQEAMAACERAALAGGTER